MDTLILKDYKLGDMIASYRTDNGKKKISLFLLPADFHGQEQKKNTGMDCLVQYKLTGDIYNEAYALGNSMRNGQSVRQLEFMEQTEKQENGSLKIITTLKDERGYEMDHILCWEQGTHFIKISCCFKNYSENRVTLEMLESFSLAGLSPYLYGDGQEGLNLHRIRSVWSQEGRHEVIPVEDLQLEPAWDPHAVRCERYGQTGSMPVNKYFPFVAIEDKINHIFWGAQLAHPASWQMEVYRKDDALCISGGLADRDFGHWMKNINAGEDFTTPEAILTVACTESFDEFTNRLVEAAVRPVEQGPKIEQELPIIFNEYCTTWGNPSHENICEIVDCIKDKGFTYFVIDCGWYKKAGIPWDVGMGDYEVSKELFPQGLQCTINKIKDAGMIPGIWFEIETVGEAAKAFHYEDHLLHKDGVVLTSYFRRFWNMCDPWVESYLTEKVIDFLKRYDFGYMKIDYNETIGIGCDGSESLGEGLRKNLAATQNFIEKIKAELPGIVLENCASGGHRLEPSLMAQMSMASFSDAHECPEIPIIAANLHRVIQPRQSQIWAVIRENDSLKRIVYSISSTFLGRMCISGDVIKLGREQWKLITEGMNFYKMIAPIIKKGQSYKYGNKIKSIRHPRGWQAVIRVGENGDAYLVLHVFEGMHGRKINFQLPEGCPQRISKIYSANPENVIIDNKQFYYDIKDDWKALTLYLSQDDNSAMPM